MFVGHYSAAFAVKAANPGIPLWVLFGAAQLVDIGWAIFIILGIEHVRIVPGFTAANPLDLYHMPFTHSLSATILWALGAGLLYVAIARPRNGWRIGAAIAAVVASHWALDWLVHVPDLPLWANQYKTGLGLWNHLWLSVAIEAALLAVALWWYMRATTTLRPAGRWAMPAFAVVISALWIGNLFAPPPTSVMALGLSALFSYLVFAAIAGWLARFRAPRHT